MIKQPTNLFGCKYHSRKEGKFLTIDVEKKYTP